MVVGVTNSNTAKNALVDDFSPRIRPRALAVGSRSLNVWELCGLSDIAQEPYTLCSWCLAPSQLRRCSVRCLNYTMLFCSAKNSRVSPPAALFRCNHYWPHKSICLPSPPPPNCQPSPSPQSHLNIYFGTQHDSTSMVQVGASCGEISQIFSWTWAWAHRVVMATLSLLDGVNQPIKWQWS